MENTSSKEKKSSAPLGALIDSALSRINGQRLKIEDPLMANSQASSTVVTAGACELGLSSDNFFKIIQPEFESQIFSAFIRPLRFKSYDEARGIVSVDAPSRLIKTHIERDIKSKIEAVLQNRLGVPSLSLRIEVGEAATFVDAVSEEGPKEIVVKHFRRPQVVNGSSGAGFAREPLPSGLNSKYTFANFVVGSSNQFCHAVAIRVAERPGQSYNPLFIYGGVGLGKTHLLHAIGNAVRAQKPSAKILYISSETFTNELIQALRLGKMGQFKDRMRGIDVLLVDDVQFLCGKERTQEEFFHTFNSLYEAKRQIVISSDKIPQGIAGLEDRLKTRFSWGLTADLQAPDFETRVAILNRKAAIDGVSLPKGIAELLAEKIFSNVRELEGALTRLIAAASLQGHTINQELAETVLKSLLQHKPVKLSVQDIKLAVAQHFSLKVSDMISKRRTRNLSFPRHIGMYLCRKHTTYSYPEIGTHFGGRDHSSVIHAAHVVGCKLESDPAVKLAVEEIERKLLSA